MKIKPSVPSDALTRFLMGLNGDDGFIRDLVELERTSDYSLRPKNKKLDREVRQAYVTHLRRLADEWISTGRQGGAECPHRRSLVGFDPKIHAAISKWLVEHRPYLGLAESGETTIFMPWVMLDYSSPFTVAEGEAINYFCAFLDSPYRTRLFKCHSCETYYYTKRQPRALIKNGTYCDAHRHVASAKRSNVRKRVPEQNRKLELAAQWWGRWPKSRSADGDRADWIAGKINQGIRRSSTPIKRNWVTRNRTAIEIEVERRANATS